MKRLLLFICIPIILLSCNPKGEVEELEPISPAPQILSVKVEPREIEEGGSFQFLIEYQDGDGDLGNIKAEDDVVFITDPRFPLTVGFHVQPLAPYDSTAQGNYVIRGTLELLLESVILKDAGSEEESVTFEVKLKDRSGKESNIMVSEVCRVKRP